MPILYLIIPCYNAEKVLSFRASKYIEKLSSLIINRIISEESRILFINDGSTDSTWEIIKYLARDNEHYIGMSLSRRFGLENALLAGYLEIKERFDIAISINYNDKYDLAILDEMIIKYNNGFDIVYAKEFKRKTSSPCKKSIKKRIEEKIRNRGFELFPNTIGYILISSKVAHYFAKYHEVNFTLQGIISMVGFSKTTVFYKNPRDVDTFSHSSVLGRVKKAFDIITNQTIKPIKYTSTIGLIVIFLSVIAILWAIIQSFTGNAVSGWISITCIVAFTGGINLLAIGIIGEYVGKTYLETKERPRYIIREKTFI